MWKLMQNYLFSRKAGMELKNNLNQLQQIPMMQMTKVTSAATNF
jgi:hypothetical protein